MNVTRLLKQVKRKQVENLLLFTILYILVLIKELNSRLRETADIYSNILYPVKSPDFVQAEIHPCDNLSFDLPSVLQLSINWDTEGDKAFTRSAAPGSFYPQ